MNAPSQAAKTEAEDFSIVLGGPLYQIYRKAHLCGTGVELLKRRLIGFPMFTWLPLVVLSVLGGRAIQGSSPFFKDLVGFMQQGPVVLMIENYRSGLLWDIMRRCLPLVSGLRRAGFAGGWL